MSWRGGGRGGGFRGGFQRGGGGPPFGGGPPPAAPPPMPMPSAGGSRPPFDLTLCEPMFPKVKEVDDSELTQCLLKRNDNLSPSPPEQAAVMNLMNKVNSAIEKRIVAPELFTAAAIEEARPVGSYKKGTMTTKHNIADLVVVLKTLPTIEAVTALGNKIVEDIKAAEPKEVLGCVPREFGCEIAGTQAVIRLLITTIPPNLKKLEPDLHLDAKLVRGHFSAVRHARWFEENASHSSVKMLVRIMKDVRNRFAGLKPLNIWALELLCHYAIMNTPSRQPLPMNQAFRRIFQLLAAGLFLPGSAGLIDPCEQGSRIQDYITIEDQDLLCSTAQTLLRVLSHGGYKHILGIEGSASVATEMSVWDGIVVTPLEKAYDPKEMEPLEIEKNEDASLKNGQPQS